MNIVLIHGQNHIGSSAHIGRLLAAAFSGAEVREFFLPKDLPHFCKGCYRCIYDPHACPYDREKMNIMHAVLEADLLVITTPTYCMAPSAALKSFLDLTFPWWMVHRPDPRMFFKQAVVITTAAGRGMHSAIKPVKNALFYWGIPKVYTFGKAVQAMNWDQVSEKKKQEITASISRMAARIQNGAPVKAGLKTKLVFELMRQMHKSGQGSSKEETEYWNRQGWLEKKRPWKK